MADRMNTPVESLSVLIADDDPIFCNMLQLTLEQNGLADIATASNGRKVRDHIHAGRKVDVITLDLNMPDYDGVEVLNMLAKAGFDGLVILISGADKAIVEAASVYAEATLSRKPVVFTKPVNWDRIANRIMEFAVRAK